MLSNKSRKRSRIQNAIANKALEPRITSIPEGAAAAAAAPGFFTPPPRSRKPTNASRMPASAAVLNLLRAAETEAGGGAGGGGGAAYPNYELLESLKSLKKAAIDRDTKLSDFDGNVGNLQKAFAAVENRTNQFEEAADAATAAANLRAALPAALDWYKLDKKILPIKNYLLALRNIYIVMAIGEKDAEYVRDPIMKMIYIQKYKISEDEWLQMERKRRFFKNLEAKMGDFHELLAGSFPGYETLPNGHWSGCDVRKVDNSEYWEFKNRSNTMNHGSKSAVANKMDELDEKLATQGLPAATKYLALINTPISVSGTPTKPIRKFLSEDTITLNGPDTYAHISGDPTFFEKLLVTIHDTIEAIPNFPTYVATLKSLGENTQHIEREVFVALRG